MTKYDRKLRRAAHALLDGMRNWEDSEAGDSAVDALASDLRTALSEMPPLRAPRPKHAEPLDYPNPADAVIAAQQLAARQHELFLSSVYSTISTMRNALIVTLSDTCTLDPKAEEQVRKALLGMGD